MAKQVFSSKVVKESQPKRFTKFGVGIHDNVEMTAINLGLTNSGKQFMEFVFEREETAETHNKRVWYPDADNPRPRTGETADDAAQREVNEALEHIIAILEVYLPSDKAVIMATSFDDFCKKAKAKLQSKIKGKKVRIKILYDANGVYTQFAKYPPYVELQVEGQRSRLKVSKWEKENRMSPSEAPKSDDPIVGGTSKVIDDLPF